MPFQLPFHDLYHAVGGGTKFNILFEYVHVIYHSLSGMVRKACTVARAHFINGAFIVGKIQKLAWLHFVNPVALPVFSKVLFLELVYSHSYMRGDAYHVAAGVGR